MMRQYFYLLIACHSPSERLTTDYARNRILIAPVSWNWMVIGLKVVIKAINLRERKEACQLTHREILPSGTYSFGKRSIIRTYNC